MATLPAGLQDAIRGDEINISTGDNVVRTKMAIGAERSRRRSSLRVDVMPLSMTLSIPLLTEFEDFFTNTTRDGSLPFYMVHPVKGGQVKVRFTKKGYKLKTIGDRVFSVTTTVEIIE